MYKFCVDICSHCLLSVPPLLSSFDLNTYVLAHHFNSSVFFFLTIYFSDFLSGCSVELLNLEGRVKDHQAGSWVGGTARWEEAVHEWEQNVRRQGSVRTWWVQITLRGCAWLTSHAGSGEELREEKGRQ